MTTKEDILSYIEWYKNEYEVEQNPIFQIMLFEKPNEEFIYHKPEGDVKSGFPDTGCQDNTGFYYELDTAIHAMNENWLDIQDHAFYAGFILCHFPGLYPDSSTNYRMYFVWDKEKEGFFQQEEPEIFKYISY